MKRIFIAVKVDPEPLFLRINSTLKSLLKEERITWVDPSNLHITLAFLGDTEEEMITIAGILLKKVCIDFHRFSFNLLGTGIFRSYSDPRVLWCGIAQSQELVSLHKSIISGLTDAGFKMEERHFKPHITLGRIRSIRDNVILKRAVEQFQSTIIQKVFVSEVILFGSILKPSGPVYKPIGRFKLQA